MAHNAVQHPKELLKKDFNSIEKFNTWLAVKITAGVGTMACAWLFAVLALISLPAALASGNIITIDFWICQNFLQLVLLSIIMVGQNVMQKQSDAKVETDHRTLTYLATIQDEQLMILKKLEAAQDGKTLSKPETV